LFAVFAEDDLEIAVVELLQKLVDLLHHHLHLLVAGGD
jgi:hypothetical protein